MTRLTSFFICAVQTNSDDQLIAMLDMHSFALPDVIESLKVIRLILRAKPLEYYKMKSFFYYHCVNSVENFHF